MAKVILLLLLACYVLAETQVRYVHLAFTKDPTEMVVGWYTEDESATSTVSYGLDPQHLAHTATGTSNYWKKGYGYNHFVLLQNLQTSQRYYYKCGDASGGWSNVYNFTTAPNTTVPFTVGIYGDMGIVYSQPNMNRIIDRTKKGELDWIFHVGDISYADDHVLTFQKTWNTWFERMEPVTSVLPYMVGPGNHEYESHDPLLIPSTRNFVVYNHRFMMPNANSESKSMYYSFDYSNVHFVSYSTETSFHDAPYGEADNFGDEVSWLEQDLKTANLPENRKKRPWIIVTGHRPIYSSSVGYSKDGVPINSKHPPSNSLTLQKTFEELFYKYKVDLIFNGHVHSYERNYPAYKNKKVGEYSNLKAPAGIVIGCAGNIEGLSDPKNSSWTWPQPEWSAYRYGEDYGYGMLRVFNHTHMSWKFYTASDNHLRDEVLIAKQ